MPLNYLLTFAHPSSFCSQSIILFGVFPVAFSKKKHFTKFQTNSIWVIDFISLLKYLKHNPRWLLLLFLLHYKMSKWKRWNKLYRPYSLFLLVVRPMWWHFGNQNWMKKWKRKRKKWERDRDVPEYISRLNVNRRCHYLHFDIGYSGSGSSSRATTHCLAIYNLFVNILRQTIKPGLFYR